MKSLKDIIYEDALLPRQLKGSIFDCPEIQQLSNIKNISDLFDVFIELVKNREFKTITSRCELSVDDSGKDVVITFKFNVHSAMFKTARDQFKKNPTYALGKLIGSIKLPKNIEFEQEFDKDILILKK